jgi:acyl carrier protein
VPDRFGGAGARLYRTGDLVRWRSGGELDFLGRADGQVKVRGLRIELAEIEAVLASHPAVLEAAVVAVADAADGSGTAATAGGLRLAAFVVARDDDDAAPAAARDGQPAGLQHGLRRHLRERLPEAMVPAAIFQLAALPLGTSGKVDRRALAEQAAAAPAGAAGAAGAAAAASPPRTPVEEVVAAIWADVLGLAQVGAGDRFFDLGGHSLLATRVVSRLRQVFGVEVPLKDLFGGATVADLARDIEGRRGPSRTAALPAILPVPRAQALPLSFAQQRLWLASHLEPAKALYNMSFGLRLRGALQVAALARTLAEVVRRHEVLRTTFPVVDRQPVQAIAPPRPFALPLADLAALPAAAREAEVARLAAEQAAVPFDLAAGPLFVVRLLRLGAGEHALLLTLHHIVCDGWSLAILVDEVSAIYAALAAGRACPLPDLAVQYADFAWWQRGRLAGGELERLLGYWRRQLAGMRETPALPGSRSRPRLPTHRGGREVLALPAAVSQAVKELCRREGVTLFMVLLAAFKVVLARATGQTDLAIGAPIAGRTTAETETLIGCFVNMLVLRTDLAGNPTFRALLARVRQVALDAYAHQELPFERLVDDLQPAREPGKHPLFQATCGVQNAPGDPLDLPGLALEPLLATAEVARFDLTLWATDGPAGLVLSWTYSADLLDAAGVRRLHAQLATVLQEAAARPDLEIGLLEVVPEPERRERAARQQALARASYRSFRGTAAARPGKPAPQGARNRPEKDVETL